MTDTTWCIICRKPIAPERAVRSSVTCGKACAAQLVKVRRAMIDARRCRQCHAPSSPEERKLFAQWRRERGEVKTGRPKAAPEAKESPLAPS